MRHVGLAAITLTLCLAGCKASDNAGEGGGGMYWLVTHGEPENSFWAPVRVGMLEAAQERGVSAEFKGAVDPETPAAEQQADTIREAIDARVNGIGVTVTDPVVLGDPIRDAVAAGIPVVAINIPISAEDRKTYDLPIFAYVGQVEALMASQAATHAHDLIVERGGTMDLAVCIKGSVELPWAVQRCQGMTDALTALDIQVETLAGDFFFQPPDVPTADIEAWFRENPEVDFVFTTATPVLNLALSMQADGIIGPDTMIGSVDLNEETLDAIRTGRCEFAVDQQPYLQGYLPIHLLELNRNFALRPGGDVLTGPFYVEASNVDDIQELVSQGVR